MDKHERAASYRLKESLIRERIKDSLSDAVAAYGIGPPTEVSVQWRDEMFRIRAFYFPKYLEITLDEDVALNMPKFVIAEMVEHIVCTALIEIAEPL